MFVFGGHVSISQHHRRLQCLTAAGSSYAWDASRTEELPNCAGHAPLLSQPAKSRKWNSGTRQKAKCGSTYPSQATETAALCDCSPSGPATRELGCHLLRPSRGVLHTCRHWPRRPPTARQRRVSPPLRKDWPQANTAMQRKETIIVPSTGTGHAWGMHAAWGRSRRQQKLAVLPQRATQILLANGRCNAEKHLISEPSKFAGFSISRWPTPLVRKTRKPASSALQAHKDAHPCRRQL